MGLEEKRREVERNAKAKRNKKKVGRKATVEKQKRRPIV